jgi:hypothetical protein
MNGRPLTTAETLAGDRVPVPALHGRLGEFHSTDQTLEDIGSLAAELTAAFAEQRPVASRSATLAGWAGALDLLFFAWRTDVLAYGARQLAEAHPGFELAETISAFVARLPPLGDGHLPFADKRLRSVQVVPRSHCDTVILLFCDQLHSLGMPLSGIHRWMGRLPASLVYLRDFRRLYYLAGIPELGRDRESTIDALRGLIAELGGRRLLCYGSSAGSFAAFDYGAALGAEAVLGMAGPANLLPDFNTHLRWAASAQRIRETVPEAVVDLRRIYARDTALARLAISYGEHQWDDRLQAEHLAGLPNIELRPVPDYAGHNAAMELIRRGEFESLVDWFIGKS